MHRHAISRRRAVQYLAGGLALPFAAACQSQAAPTPTPVNPLIKPKAATGVPLTAVVASSEHALGRNRFALGLIDAHNQPVATGSVHLDFFKLTPRSNTGEKRGEAEATFRSVEIVSRGIWVSSASFDEVGPWGARAVLTRPGEQPVAAQVDFQVREKFSSPGYDAPAPKTPSPVLSDVGGDAARLCSNAPPCDLHAINLADALSDGQKPLVVLFATPAFCTTATCAPELSAVQGLRAAGYGEKAHFVHVEIYDHPFAEMKPSRTVVDWGLPSEPWVFVVDRNGVVRDRFEGAAPVDELEPALRALV